MAYRGRLRLESLERRDLLAADLTTLDPADDGVAMVDANLVLTFSEDVRQGPGTGNIFIQNADDGSLIEALNVASDRVTFDGSKVTIDPVNDLATNANFFVLIDNAAIRDTSTDVVNTTLLIEDFEGLTLRDSDLANDAGIADVNDYVVIMSGTLDVEVAGAYTFGGNSDDGQQLAIDVEQNGFDLIDDEIIFDNTTHGSQDRLSVCGSEFTGQSCVGDGGDPITLGVGEYEFEYWYFDRSGGSGGELFYAPGTHERFDPDAFVLVGDDSQGIGVTADGITATTYKAASDQITDLEIAFDLAFFDGFLDSVQGFPFSETISTADVYNTGGPGRFPDNHPLPGYPPPGPEDGLDWSDDAPFGWKRDNSNLPPGGPDEFAGWVFQDKQFWINQQGNQGRVNYTRGENIIAVVDPDAYDDFVNIDPNRFSASLSSPNISLVAVAANTATISFDSSWLREDQQAVELRVEYFDATDASLGDNVIFRWESEAGANFKDHAVNEAIEDLALNNPENATSMVVTWDMPQAGNDNWWAIDNISVSADMNGNPFTGIADNQIWNFSSFSVPTISFDPVEASVAEDGSEVSLTLIREGDASVPVSVNYATSAGTAKAADITVANGTVNFAAGETEKTILIGIAEDTEAEADETFRVTLGNPTGGTKIGDGTATVTIIDNDRPVIVFQQDVETTINGVGTGATYTGTSDADPREASPDESRDRREVNPDGADGGGEIHALTAFQDLFGDGPGQIPSDAIVTRATLVLNVVNPGTPIRVHRLLGEFNEEQVTWNNLMLNGNTEPGLQADGVEATPALREFTADPAEIIFVDVTEDLQVWISGEADNFGWGFTPTGTNGVDWDSSTAVNPGVRPKLEVEYVVVPAPDLSGDVDGDGTVAFPDFLILSANFGQTVEPSTNGDIDGDGTVAFGDFLILSANFGQSVAAVAAAVDAALADLTGGGDD